MQLRRWLIVALVMAFVASLLILPDCRRMGEAPRLPTTPPAESETDMVIGKAGGTVSAEGISIEIPAGAVEKNTMLSISRLDQETLPCSTPLFTEFLGAASFGPDGLRFNKDVLATIPLVEPRTPGEILDLCTYDAERQAFVSTGIPATVTNDGMKVQAKISHFSIYSVLDGLTGLAFLRIVNQVLDGGGTAADATRAVMDLIHDQGVDLGVCVYERYEIAGIDISFSYESDGAIGRDFRSVGRDTGHVIVTTAVTLKTYMTDDRIHREFRDIGVQYYLSPWYLGNWTVILWDTYSFWVTGERCEGEASSGHYGKIFEISVTSEKKIISGSGIDGTRPGYESPVVMKGEILGDSNITFQIVEPFYLEDGTYCPVLHKFTGTMSCGEREIKGTFHSAYDCGPVGLCTVHFRAEGQFTVSVSPSAGAQE